MITNLEVYSSLSSAPDLPLAVGGTGTDDPLQMRDLQGLGPVKAAVTTKPYGDMDGEFYTGTSVGKRNITLSIGLNPDWVDNTVSSLRQKVYGYFMPKQPIRLRLFGDDLPAVEIRGYTESCEPSIFSQDPAMDISVICPAPDFVAVAPSQVTGLADDAADAVEVAFTRIGNVDTSIDLLVGAAVGDASTYEGLITFEHKTLAPADTSIFAVTGTIVAGVDYHLDSRLGGKKAENLYVGGEVVNLLNSMTVDSKWPKLTPGTNRVRVLLATGAASKEWALTYYERFGGL